MCGVEYVTFEVQSNFALPFQAIGTNKRADYLVFRFEGITVCFV